LLPIRDQLAKLEKIEGPAPPELGGSGNLAARRHALDGAQRQADDGNGLLDRAAFIGRDSLSGLTHVQLLGCYSIRAALTRRP
jgi:hypothetical protein